MRVAIVTESFLPHLNGVTTSVCRVAECLRDRGHEAVILAPRPAPSSHAGYAVHGLASVPVRQFPVGLPMGGEVEAVLADFAPDVVHVASPFVLGASALSAAARLDLPTVAVYQTDMPSYIRQHGPGAVGRGAARAAWRWIRRMHEMADLTLAPSSATLAELRAHGIPRTAAVGARGGRGAVPPRLARRRRHPGAAPVARAAGAGAGRATSDGSHPRRSCTGSPPSPACPNLRVVLVGEGPTRHDDAATLAAAGVDAVFLGRREGDDLARAYAAFDLFVHTGTRETFGQTLQEAAATGLPVVAPPAVARSTWWTTRGPGCSSTPRTRLPCARRWPTWPGTGSSARPWARPGGSGWPTAAGRR